ncbi:glycosyltransferase [Salegentibacter sp. HM20]
MMPRYSFVIPVYNRPDEIRELLQSMLELDFQKNFEVVIVEDGSSLTSENICKEFGVSLDIQYFYKKNSGPGDSRNFGMKKARGDWFLILDSDVILPENYLREVDSFLASNACDCFGGPDAAHKNFTRIQKAIDFSMTSFLTTGGIRGGARAVDEFQPRSFNMGISRKAFEISKGFGLIHPGEDPDLSLRLKKAGLTTCLIPGAKVYHKRRIGWSKFYTQVYKFGLVRPILNQWHPGSEKITYWFPSLFSGGLILSVLLLKPGIWWPLLLYAMYFILIFTGSAIKNKSLIIGALSLQAVIIQFFGYGYGFLESTWQVKILQKQPEKEFPQLFFKHAKSV